MKNKGIMLSMAAVSLTLVATGFSLMNSNDTKTVSAQVNPSVSILSGASVRKSGRIVEGVEQAATPSIRFIANVADKTKDYGMIIVPWDYVAELSVTEENFDYYSALVGEGKKYLLFEYTEESQIGTWETKDSIIGSIDQIRFENINREYIAIAYANSGTEKEFAEVSSENARSVAWVSSAALNKGETGTVLTENLMKSGYQMLGVTYADSEYVYGEESYATIEELSGVLDYTDAFAFATKATYAKVGDKVEMATDNLKELQVKWVSTNEDVATVDENGQVTALTTGATTIKAYVGTDVEHAVFVSECTIEVMTEEAYVQTLDPMNSAAFEGVNIRTRKDTWATFTYDATEGAYKYHATKIDTETYYNNHMMLVFADGSHAADMINYNAQTKEYAYVALDLKYTGTMGTDFGEFMFLSSGDRNAMLGMANVKVADAQGNFLEKSEMTAGVWYTIYVPAPTSLTIDPTCAAYCFMRTGAAGAVYSGNTDYWMKNVRLENLPLQVQNGYVYEESLASAFLPTSTVAYTVTKAPQGITVEGNKISSLKAGEYTVVGDKTISFIVYTAEEYAKVIASLTSTQFSDALTTRNNAWAECTFDETEGAYKHHATMTDPATASYVDNHVVTALSGSAVEKIKVNIDSKTYGYIALDLKYSGTMGTDFRTFEFSNTGTRAGFKAITDSSIKVCNKDGQVINASEMQAGEWYTIYMAAPTSFTKDLNTYFFIRQVAKTANRYTDYWVKNIRFATELPMV